MSIKKTDAREYAFNFFFQHISSEGLNGLHEHAQKSNDPRYIDQLLDNFNLSYFIEDDEKDQSTNQLSDDQLFYARKIIVKTLNEIENTISLLNSSLKNKNLGDLSPVEQSILTLALGEKEAMKEIPKAVILNEYIELSKKYGSNESYSLINGVLDKLI